MCADSWEILSRALKAIMIGPLITNIWLYIRPLEFSLSFGFRMQSARRDCLSLEKEPPQKPGTIQTPAEIFDLAEMKLPNRNKVSIVYSFLKFLFGNKNHTIVYGMIVYYWKRILVRRISQASALPNRRLDSLMSLFFLQKKLIGVCIACVHRSM